jgi:hypothetical protein
LPNEEIGGRSRNKRLGSFVVNGMLVHDGFSSSPTDLKTVSVGQFE